MQSSQKDWTVEVQGQIFEADLDELKQWIVEGAVLPTDRVRRGSLRWLAAEKVPEIYAFFNSSDFNSAASTPADTDNSSAGNDSQTQLALENSLAESEWIAAQESTEKICFSHPGADAVFACDVCRNFFCKTCPNSYGSVKLCPVCGALCRGADEAMEVHKSIGAVNKPYLKIDDELNNHGNAGQNRFQAMMATLMTFYRKPLYLVLAAALVTLIFGAAHFILFATK
jgi:hypothetical protein